MAILGFQGHLGTWPPGHPGIHRWEVAASCHLTGSSRHHTTHRALHVHEHWPEAKEHPKLNAVKDLTF